MEFSDGYVNEHGVAIASDNCPSREDQPEFTDGGIGYWLRRLMAERATSAREAVKIGGALVEKFGYTAAGRSYCIAGPNEAWVMCVVRGKHWVAQRVPDDKVMIIPNYYMIQEINLADTINFMGSKDIIDYAVIRGWYDSEKDGEFNFREVYGVDWSINHQHNINRQWGALRLISEEEYDLNDNFPFAVTPKKKLDLDDIFAVLRDHYEGTSLENSDHSQTPHEDDNRPICTLSTQYAFVAQLRNNFPKALNSVIWYSPVQPCLHPFVPVYTNISEFPPLFAHENYRTGLKRHFADNYSELKSGFTGHAFQSFTEFAKWVNEDYYDRSPEIIQKNSKIEQEIIQNHFRFDKNMLEIYRENPSKVQKMITDYSTKNLKLLTSLQFD